MRSIVCEASCHQVCFACLTNFAGSKHIEKGGIFFLKSLSTLYQLFAAVTCAELTELSSSLSFDCTSVGINPGYGSAEHRAGEKIKQSPAECYLYKYQQLTFNTTILRLDSTPFVQRSIGWSLHHQLLH